MADSFYALSAYDVPRSDDEQRRELPMPSLLRSLLSEHLDPGYAAAATRRRHVTPAADPGRDSWIRAAIWEAIAALLGATVFAVAVAQARSVAPGERDAQRLLAANVRSAENVAHRLADRRETLTAQVNALRRHRLADDAQGQRLLAALDRLSLEAASNRVTGPGLTITVTDPGLGRNLSDASKGRVSGSQQIILDRDLQLVVNSLWASGAEAIAVGDVRIGPDVTIRQAGGAILVDNTPISSPYLVRAIGPEQELRSSFERSPGLYRLWLLEFSYGVGVRLDSSSGTDLTLPAGSVRALRFAKPLGES